METTSVPRDTIAKRIATFRAHGWRVQRPQATLRLRIPRRTRAVPRAPAAEQDAGTGGGVPRRELDGVQRRGAVEMEAEEEVGKVVPADDQIPSDVRRRLRRGLGRSGEEDEGPGQGERGEQRNQHDERRVLPRIRDLALEDLRKVSDLSLKLPRLHGATPRRPPP